MDNGFIFKKNKLKLKYKREKKILGAVFDLPARVVPIYEVSYSVACLDF